MVIVKLLNERSTARICAANMSPVNYGACGVITYDMSSRSQDHQLINQNLNIPRKVN